MPAFAESVLFGALQLGFWGAVLVCAVAATVLAVRQHSTPDPAVRAPDPVFWDVFMGSAVALPDPYSHAGITLVRRGPRRARDRGGRGRLPWQPADPG
ncbi:MAG: hypothetical protein M3536_12105, partial [Actinomycetota bacterium]|nr:hypothetical protein [Actinomycetota bacterium]